MFMMTAKDQRISASIQFSEQKVTHDCRRSGTHACLGLCRHCTALDTRRRGWKVPCHVQTSRGVNKLFYFWHEILSVDCLNVEKWGKVLNALLSSFPCRARLLIFLLPRISSNDEKWEFLRFDRTRANKLEQTSNDCTCDFHFIKSNRTMNAFSRRTKRRDPSASSAQLSKTNKERSLGSLLPIFFSYSNLAFPPPLRRPQGAAGASAPEAKARHRPASGNSRSFKCFSTKQRSRSKFR